MFHSFLTASALVLLLLAGLGTGCGAPPPPPPETPPELRGVWLTNIDSDVLDSRAQIAEAMQFLADHHFNVVFPVVWNGGYTLYPSPTMERLFDAPIDTAYAGRDPLAEVIEEAHRRGIAVIPWFEFGFASSYQQDGGHILQRQPGWAARDRSGQLLTKNGFEWMNPYHPEVQDFLLALVMEVVDGYAVDGIQGDDRLPAQPSEGGYAAYTDSLYRADHDGAAPPDDPQDPGWLRWRADRLNAFGKRVYDAVKAADATLQVSWAPSVYPWSYHEYLQDWPSWVRGGYADLLHPQVYRYDLARYRETLDALDPDSLGLADAIAPDTTIPGFYPGILMKVGDYRIPADYLLAALDANRARGYRGEVFFFYEGLRTDDDVLADTLRATYYRTPARLPFPPAFRTPPSP